MDKSKVTLNLETYNELRDYKKNHFDGKIYTYFYDGRNIRQFKFYTKDEILSIINTAYENERKRAEEQKFKIDSIKKMSYWEFRKWKKSNV